MVYLIIGKSDIPLITKDVNMIKEILFGLVDNGVLIFGALIGFSLDDKINTLLEWALKQTPYRLVTRIKGVSATILGAGIGNAISDFLGGWCISINMAFGTFFGCLLVVVVILPFIFKLEKRG